MLMKVEGAIGAAFAFGTVVVIVGGKKNVTIIRIVK